MNRKILNINDSMSTINNIAIYNGSSFYPTCIINYNHRFKFRTNQIVVDYFIEIVINLFIDIIFILIINSTYLDNDKMLYELY